MSSAVLRTPEQPRLASAQPVARRAHGDNGRLDTGPRWRSIHTRPSAVPRLASTKELAANLPRPNLLPEVMTTNPGRRPCFRAPSSREVLPAALLPRAFIPGALARHDAGPPA